MKQKNKKSKLVNISLIVILCSGVIFTSLHLYAQISSVTIMILSRPIIDSVTYNCKDNDTIKVHVSNQITNCVYTIINTIPVTNLQSSNSTGVFNYISGVTDAVIRVHNGVCYTDTSVHFDCEHEIRNLKLNYFNVRLQPNEAQISFESQEDDQIEKFEIEESYNGNTFKYLATIIGKQNHGPQVYEISDTFLFKGYNYYRIKINGHDGAIRYSPARFVINNTNNVYDFVWYPNPTNKYVYLEFYNEHEDENIKINMHKVINGQKEIEKIYPLNQGFNKIAIDVSYLMDGAYILQYEIGNKTKTGNIRFQKIAF